MQTDRVVFRRRKFLAAGVGAVAAPSLISCGKRGGGPYWRFFTAAEARTVDAVCEQIIPADGFPGAREAGVVNFIDAQLVRHYKKHQEAYRKGVAAVDAAAQAQFKKPFASLSFEQQTEVLTGIEEKAPEFFSLIRTHTMQGFYGDPRHGGNRGQVSWRMLGLTGPQVRGRLPYQTEKS